jgi:hypothetical protein
VKRIEAQGSKRVKLEVIGKLAKSMAARVKGIDFGSQHGIAG